MESYQKLEREVVGVTQPHHVHHVRPILLLTDADICKIAVVSLSHGAVRKHLQDGGQRNAKPSELLILRLSVATALLLIRIIRHLLLSPSLLCESNNALI